MDKLKVRRVKFKTGLPDLIILESEYSRYKGFYYFLSEYSIAPKTVESAKIELLDIKDFPNKEWEG